MTTVGVFQILAFFGLVLLITKPVGLFMARVFEGEQALLTALDQTPDSFQNNDMIIVRYEGPSGAPGMPEMLDPTSRITTLCRERGIVVALMTDARFSGGSVGLVIGHVGPEAGLGGPIAFVEDGDEIIVGKTFLRFFIVK